MSESAKSAREKARKAEDRGTLYVCVFGLILTATLALLHFTSSGVASGGSKTGPAGGRGIGFYWGGGIDWARKALGGVFHWKGSGKFSKAPGAPVMDIPFDQREDEAEDLVHADRVGMTEDFADPEQEGSDRLPNAQSLGLTSSQGAAGGGGSGSAGTGRFSESVATRGSEATVAPEGTAESAATRAPGAAKVPGAAARAQASHSGAGRRGIGGGAPSSPHLGPSGRQGPSAQEAPPPSPPPPARVDQSEAIIISQVRDNLGQVDRALTKDIAAGRALGGALSADVPFFNTRPSRVVAEVILNNPLKKHEVPASQQQARWSALNQIAQTLQPSRIESSNALKAGGALMGPMTSVQGKVRSASGSISSAVDAIAKQKTALDGLEEIPLHRQPLLQLRGRVEAALKINDNAINNWKHKGGPLMAWLEKSHHRLVNEKKLLDAYLMGSTLSQSR